MILFHTVIKNFRKSFVMNLMTLLQTTATLIATVMMVSTLSITFQYYNPFRDYFQENGLLVRFESMHDAHVNLSTDAQGRIVYDTLENTNELKSYLHGNVKSILACHRPITLVSGIGIPSISYEDEVIERFQPELSDGHWLSNGKEAAELEVVISENEYGWKVGDTIEMEFLNEQGAIPISAKVIGKIKEGSRVLGFNLSGNEDQNFLLSYKVYRYDVEQEPIFIFSNSALERINPKPQLGICYTTFIQYTSDVTEDIIELDKQTLASMGAVGGISMKKLEKGNQKYITEQFLKLMPITIVLLALVMISSISCSALAVKRRLRDYAIFYTVGLPWRHTILINFIQSALICVVSLVVAIISLFAISQSGLQETFRVIWNMEALYVMVAVILVQMVASLIIPLQQLHHTTAKAILSSERK